MKNMFLTILLNKSDYHAFIPAAKDNGAFSRGLRCKAACFVF